MTAHVRRGAAAALAAWMLAVGLQASRRALVERGADLQPPRLLSETGLYVDGRIGEIDPRNRPFAPQYPLWSDGLTKRRWIRLPDGSTIDGRDEMAWSFPVGTKIWKQFALGTRPVETRLLWKATPDGWVFAAYAWNADGTAAELAPDEGIFGVAEVAPGRRHTIPGKTDCAACHGQGEKAGPIGVTALQLSTDRDPNAIHAEPLQPGMLTNKTLIEEGLLAGARSDLVSAPPRIQTANPATRAMLGYFASNCAMCHNGKGEIAALGPVIRLQDLVSDADAVARSLIGQRTRWQLPGEPAGESVLVHDGVPEKSAIYVRMRSRSPSSQMPPLGTTVRDEQAVEAIAKWIASMRR